MLSRGAADRGAAREEVGAGLRANCFNKAAGGTVGRWLNPVIDLEARAPRRGNSAREGNIQISSLPAQRIANARRNRAEYYYSTILAASTGRCVLRRWRQTRDDLRKKSIISRFSSFSPNRLCITIINNLSNVR